MKLYPTDTPFSMKGENGVLLTDGAAGNWGESHREYVGAFIPTQYGIRVWKVDGDGVRTELTNGITTITQRDVPGSGLQYGTWTPPETAWDEGCTFSIHRYVKIYIWYELGGSIWLTDFTPATGAVLNNTQWLIAWSTTADYLAPWMIARITWGGESTYIDNITFDLPPVQPTIGVTVPKPPLRTHFFFLFREWLLAKLK